MIGNAERTIGHRQIYKQEGRYIVIDPIRLFDYPQLAIIDSFPRTVNIWQPTRDLNIWLLARNGSNYHG